MNLLIDIENASGSDDVPDDEHIHRWVKAALQALPTEQQRSSAELSVRIVSEQESQNLNHRYRQKNSPTNVLSFPSELPPELNIPLLGDLAICAQVVAREAQQQQKTADAHWAHMLVHGTLHLLDYDHIDDGDADEMEALETQIITDLGFPEPYNDTFYQSPKRAPQNS
ncbi:rRNA maturation RNase YbeY [Porticoccus sp. W117]|uniref:rRNA maturation RNase YbeY n=1 Tax=Porticoccus sp. W117 TaxID=3054777 RepID=UPI0025993D46|nr:rRNA maturation RNase YbeY [Porticoccus sp. W117]MDM3872479.1 rRNA maturation RNase YbeY [Porticoccus sp. W117]